MTRASFRGKSYRGVCGPPRIYDFNCFLSESSVRGGNKKSEKMEKRARLPKD